MYNMQHRLGAGGQQNLPPWTPDMRGCGTNRDHPGLNVLNGGNNLPYLGYHMTHGVLNPPGVGWMPGPHHSPSYMYPPSQAYGPGDAYGYGWTPF
ncbi:hypothetical protein PG993_009062 [Apiospora rasikravindrae]|uniref:Uncharacterized protein n=1 Tax=Apiospora rasikravindrae TaxID=990691 RepID=A0ABR1SIB6_9PEZI